MFKTQLIRNQKQMVNSLKTFAYFIHIMGHAYILNCIAIKCIRCVLRIMTLCFTISQMPRFKHCIFFIFQLSIFVFLLSIFVFMHFCISAFLHFSISAFLHFPSQFPSLRTFGSYFIHIMRHAYILNCIAIKCIRCVLRIMTLCFTISQMPRFKHCIFFIFQLSIFVFLLSIFVFLHFCITAFLHFCISAFSISVPFSDNFRIIVHNISAENETQM